MADLPDSSGHFSQFGGIFIADTLMQAVLDLEKAYAYYKNEADFVKQFDDALTHFVGRPSPLYFAANLTKQVGGANIYLKREDLNHTGAHKINNALGQAQLAKVMGKKRVIAETGAGQHGVATATAAARFGFDCVVYMGEEDIRRQAVNVYRMKLLGATVVPVTAGTRTLKDALNEAMRDWVTNVDTTFYIIGTAAGPHPYPMMVRDFQSIIGRETKAQCHSLMSGLPDALVACVGGGSNAIGLFHPFIKDTSVNMYGVEAAGEGLASGRHAAPLSSGKVGVLHGNRTYVMADDDGQILPTHSISAGLDYPGVGPEHAYLKEIGRVNYVTVNDEEALSAFRLLTTSEGIMPALESSHAIYYGVELAKKMPGKNIVINLSGRGDKDIHTVAAIDGVHV